MDLKDIISPTYDYKPRESVKRVQATPLALTSEECALMSDMEVLKRTKTELIQIALDTNEKVGNRLIAIDKILDRLEGKPVQRQIVVQTDGESLKKMLLLVEERRANRLINNTNLGKTGGTDGE